MSKSERAMVRHVTCRHAKACVRLACLPTVRLQAFGIEREDPVTDVLMCDCCNEYERDKEREKWELV